MVTLLLRQFGSRVALRTVQRRKCSRLAGFCERNGGPIAYVSNSFRRHFAPCYRRGHALGALRKRPLVRLIGGFEFARGLAFGLATASRA